MALASGARIGPFEVVEKLGAGGMGEVYRARDSKLKREVAIKVLPADVAADPERLARFQREAEVLASLNHPHIAHVYGIEEGALVMELVEGDDLSQRIARGPIPIDEALPIARQIAEALEAAHDAGIIHRDLKPANVKVRADGTVKVLDFGLAKALESGAGNRGPGTGSALANSPTITSPAMTMRGVILGTAAYMSPEQAKGKAVDRRTDIWAFGCVLYEMLTARRTFAGDEVSDTFVAILRDEPEWHLLPRQTPENVTRLLRRCLQKDPQRRLPHIAVARVELADPEPGELQRAEARPSHRWYVPAAVGALAGAAAIAILAATGWPAARRDVGRPAVRFILAAPDGMMYPGAGAVPRFAISPDGSRLAYQLQDGMSVKLTVRSLDSLDADTVAIEAETGGAAGNIAGARTQQPFWSPDGQSLAFFDQATSQLKKFDLRTRLTDAITNVPGNQMAGTWGAGGAILYSSVLSRGIHYVRPNGEGQRQVTVVDESRKEAAHLWPEFFGDGEHFTYLAVFSDLTPPALYIAAVDGGTPRKLFASPAGARFAPPDRLLFIRDDKLVAQRVDLRTMSTIGEPELVTDNVMFTPAGRIGVSTASHAAVTVYAAGTGVEFGEGFETHWLDRTGAPVAGAPSSVVVGLNGLRLTADGRALLYARGIMRGTGDVLTGLWSQDTRRGIESRLTTAAAPGLHAVASPDGTRVVHRAYSSGAVSLILLPISGTTTPVTLFSGEPGQGVIPLDWSRQDEILLYIGDRRPEQTGLWLLPAAPRNRATRYLAGEYRLGASFSPDGRWLVYAAGENIATAQVFVQSFADPNGRKWPVSALGGGFPRWRADGREIFYVDQRRRMFAVPITTSPQLDVGSPALLFEGVGGDLGGNLAYPYDVMPDGKRFVVARPRPKASPSSHLVVDIK